jgi:outer membrane protein TolC
MCSNWSIFSRAARRANKQPSGSFIMKSPFYRFYFFGLLGAIFHCAVGCYAAEVPAAAPASGVTLADCYQKARQISETVGISQENIKLLEAQYRDKLGSVMPHIDWIKTQFYQQNTHGGSGGVGGSILLPTQPESFFQLTQPLFAGFRDWDALSIAKSMKHQSEFDRRPVEQQLLSDVATAFYTALTIQGQLTTLQETRRVTLDRVKELQHWVDIGRSISSDLLSAQTQLATLDAQIQDTQRTEMESRELLRFLTGVQAETPLLDDRPDPAQVPLTEALDRSNHRPDLMSGEEIVQQAHLNVKYAKGSYWPTLGLLAHSYTERIGFESDVRWDATFTLDVPLLEGGSNHAQIQEARSQDIIAELTLARLKRNVEQEVRIAQQDLVASISEALAYGNAADMGQKNYEAQAKEYRQGRTSNIEVLQVLTNLQDVKRQWVASKYASKLDDVLLRVNMGEGL